MNWLIQKEKAFTGSIGGFKRDETVPSSRNPDRTARVGADPGEADSGRNGDGRAAGASAGNEEVAVTEAARFRSKASVVERWKGRKPNDRIITLKAKLL